MVQAGGDDDGEPGPGGGPGGDRGDGGIVPGLSPHSGPGQVQRGQIRSVPAQLQQLLSGDGSVLGWSGNPAAHYR